MDILSQYKQGHPEAFQEKKPPQPRDEYGRAYTGMIAFVMGLSGGAIRDVAGAHRVLLAVAVILAIVAISIFVFSGSSGTASPEPITSGLHRPIEELE